MIFCVGVPSLYVAWIVLLEYVDGKLVGIHRFPDNFAVDHGMHQLFIYQRHSITWFVQKLCLLGKVPGVYNRPPLECSSDTRYRHGRRSWCSE